MLLDCPPAASLKPITQPTCAFKLDQIVRSAFQRKRPFNTPAFATLADIQTLSNWQTQIDASDSSKIVLSPLFDSLVIPQSEALTTGGNDNSTINGIPEYNGEGSVTITGRFKNLPPITKRDLDTLAQESLVGSTGQSRLTWYPFNRDGYGFAVNPYAAGAPTTKYGGIDIYNFRISSLGSEGFNAPNTHGFSFSVAANWADYLMSYKPNFDPLVDLGAAAVVINFDSVILFAASGTPAAVAGITASAGAGNTDAEQKFEFNATPSTAGGTPQTMDITIGGTQELSVSYLSGRNGDPFKYTDKAGVAHSSTFANGTKAF